jgi:hypothetical protein
MERWTEWLEWEKDFFVNLVPSLWPLWLMVLSLNGYMVVADATTMRPLRLCG